jgi:hypothetical protein
MNPWWPERCESCDPVQELRKDVQELKRQVKLGATLVSMLGIVVPALLNTYAEPRLRSIVRDELKRAQTTVTQMTLARLP